ncbi:MAG TPA: hypothetical protein VMQ45_14460 [Burkholderiaceae bacterium]|nr:hypothetical protein [Burkholderiaceae bacterium]
MISRHDGDCSIRDAAIEQFGQHAFGVSLRAIAEEIRVADTEALQRGHDG